MAADRRAILILIVGVASAVLLVTVGTDALIAAHQWLVRSFENLFENPNGSYGYEVEFLNEEDHRRTTDMLMKISIVLSGLMVILLIALIIRGILRRRKRRSTEHLPPLMRPMSRLDRRDRRIKQARRVRRLKRKRKKRINRNARRR